MNKGDLADYITATIRNALTEDIGSGDLTATLVPENQQAQANVIARETCVLCGRPWFDEVFAQLDTSIKINWMFTEGASIEAGKPVCTVTGPARGILTGERTALNFLQSLSATATAAHTYVDAVSGTQSVILDTRKTIPGLRLAQKYAVRTGGAQNHRIGLFDAILIKENHIAAGGGIGPTLAAAFTIGADVLIEIEVETLDQARAALEGGAHRLLLDNFSPAGLAAAVELRNDIAPEITLEASGGITLENVREIAATGVDYLSIGALTKDIQAIDLSMQFKLRR